MDKKNNAYDTFEIRKTETAYGIKWEEISKKGRETTAGFDMLNKDFFLKEKFKIAALCSTLFLSVLSFSLLSACNRASKSTPPSGIPNEISATPVEQGTNKEAAQTSPPQTPTATPSPAPTQTASLTPVPGAQLYDSKTGTMLTFSAEAPIQQDLQSFPTAVPHPPEYPISVDKKTTLDEQGNPVITYTYVLSYDTDIWDVAKKVFVVNGIEYGFTDVQEPQNITLKTVGKQQICATAEAAGEFPKTIEYNGVDGNGVLDIQPATVDVQVNNTTRTPYTVAATKTYTMDVKDENSIPQTLSSKGYMLYLDNVAWDDGGDPGTGINGTETGTAYGTYNTVAQSWIATAHYSATAYNETSTYIGKVQYKGTILIKNSPTNMFIVTYKPDTPIQNASGSYKESVDANYYSQQITKENNDNQAAMGGAYQQSVANAVEAANKAAQLGGQNFVDPPAVSGPSAANSATLGDPPSADPSAADPPTDPSGQGNSTLFVIVFALIILVIVFAFIILAFILKWISDNRKKKKKKKKKSSRAVRAPDIFYDSETDDQGGE